MNNARVLHTEEYQDDFYYEKEEYLDNGLIRIFNACEEFGTVEYRYPMWKPKGSENSVRLNTLTSQHLRCLYRAIPNYNMQDWKKQFFSAAITRILAFRQGSEMGFSDPMLNEKEFYVNPCD